MTKWPSVTVTNSVIRRQFRKKNLNRNLVAGKKKKKVAEILYLGLLKRRQELPRPDAVADAIEVRPFAKWATHWSRIPSCCSPGNTNNIIIRVILSMSNVNCWNCFYSTRSYPIWRRLATDESSRSIVLHWKNKNFEKNLTKVWLWNEMLKEQLNKFFQGIAMREE